MSMMTRPLPLAYDANLWMGRSGKASYYPVPGVIQFRQAGGQVPIGALDIRGGHVRMGMIKPRLMMDPSDPSTWQRQYLFTGGQIG